MITELFLTKNQIEELAVQVVGRKQKERIVRQCIGKNICGRSTAYDALNPDKYDATNATHRLVANEAVTVLKKMGVGFEWAETQESIELPYA